MARPLIPVAHLAESLKTEFELRFPAILRLPLVEQLVALLESSLVIAFEQKIAIELELAEFGLE